MNMKLQVRHNVSRRNVLLIAFLVVAVGALYYQNVINFSNYYTYQTTDATPTSGVPLLDSGQNNVQEQRQIIQSEQSLPAAAIAPAAKSLAVPAPALATETYQEKGVLQDPFIYYGAISILGLMLLLNIFKVSFQSSAVFDSDIFKTLSSETRVEMLYALQERRKTLSELATEADISLPGAKQHLQLLESKGLVKKLDEGRKWKYYELTEQGKSIIAERFA